MNAALPHAVVLGLSPTGLYVARELGRMGVPLLGVDREFACAGVSRFLRRSDGVWYESSPAALLARLTAYSIELTDRPVIIPTNDYFIEFILRNHAKISRVFHIFDCYAGVAAKLLDKSMFQQLCLEHGIATPRVWPLCDIREIDFIVEQVSFPCLLKPTLIHVARSFLRGRKVLVAHDKSELLALANSLPGDTGSWLVQEIIPGEESRITLTAGYYGDTTASVETFTARKLRQFPPGFGSASRVISETCTETEALALHVIESIGFRGIYGAEFKRDPRDGKLKIIEINPRPTLWFHLSHTAGKRVVERAYCDLVGLPRPKAATQRDGIVWQYVLKDWASAVFYWVKGASFIFPVPDTSTPGDITGRCWPIFSLTDPLPFLAEFYVYSRKLLRRIF